MVLSSPVRSKTIYKVGPLTVINGVITQKRRFRIEPKLPIYVRPIYRGGFRRGGTHVTPFITIIRGQPCWGPLVTAHLGCQSHPPPRVEPPGPVLFWLYLSSKIKRTTVTLVKFSFSTSYVVKYVYFKKKKQDAQDICDL